MYKIGLGVCRLAENKTIILEFCVSDPAATGVESVDPIIMSVASVLDTLFS